MANDGQKKLIMGGDEFDEDISDEPTLQNDIAFIGYASPSGISHLVPTISSNRALIGTALDEEDTSDRPTLCPTQTFAELEALMHSCYVTPYTLHSSKETPSSPQEIEMRDKPVVSPPTFGSCDTFPSPGNYPLRDTQTDNTGTEFSFCIGGGEEDFTPEERVAHDLILNAQMANAEPGSILGQYVRELNRRTSRNALLAKLTNDYTPQHATPNLASSSESRERVLEYRNILAIAGTSAVLSIGALYAHSLFSSTSEPHAHASETIITAAAAPSTGFQTAYPAHEEPRQSPQTKQGQRAMTVSSSFAGAYAITLNPAADQKLAGEGISSYIVAAYQLGLGNVAKMSADDLARTVDEARISDLPQSLQRAALADIELCVTAPHNNGKMRNPDPTNLRDGTKNIISRQSIGISCLVSDIIPVNISTITAPDKDAGSLGMTTPASLKPGQTGHSLENQVNDYLHGASADFTTYSMQERLGQAALLYARSADKTSADYKTVAALAHDFGISESQIRAAAKKQNKEFSRKSYASEQREARLAEITALSQDYNKKEVVAMIADKYNISKSTVYKDIVHVAQGKKQKECIESIMKPVVSSFDVPQAVTYLRSAGKQTLQPSSLAVAPLHYKEMPKIHPYEPASPAHARREIRNSS